MARIRQRKWCARPKAAGLTAIALTDHDTVEGSAEAMAAAERLGGQVIPDN